MTYYEKQESTAIEWARMRWPLRHENASVRKALRADLGIARWYRSLRTYSWRHRQPLRSAIRYPAAV